MMRQFKVGLNSNLHVKDQFTAKLYFLDHHILKASGPVTVHPV